jgi:DNA polymerase-3 subunit gamma/tau
VKQDEDGWPETARPGGADAPADTTRPAPEPERPAPSGGRAKAPARPAKAAPPARSRGAAPATRTRDGAPPPDEPPFDPDYDRPPPAGNAAGGGYEGFDPGDEPLDDASTVRLSTEEQAMRAVSAQFTVERIGEQNPRG